MICSLDNCDYLIKNVENGQVTIELSVNKNDLFHNFDYFRLNDEMNTDAQQDVQQDVQLDVQRDVQLDVQRDVHGCVLDLGLNSGAVELCISLFIDVQPKATLNDVDHNIIMLLLEVCNVLCCTNQSLLDMLRESMANCLDRCETYDVICFCETLKNNPRLHWKLYQSVIFRMLYKIDSGLYFKEKSFTSRSTLHLKEKPFTNWSNRHHNEIRMMFVIYPKTIWEEDDEHHVYDLSKTNPKNIGSAESCNNWNKINFLDSRSFVGACDNWGEINILDSNDRIIRTTYPLNDSYVELKGMYIGVGFIEAYRHIDELGKPVILGEKYCIIIRSKLDRLGHPIYNLCIRDDNICAGSSTIVASKFKYLEISATSSNNVQYDVKKNESGEIFITSDSFGINNCLNIMTITCRLSQDSCMYINGSV